MQTRQGGSTFHLTRSKYSDQIWPLFVGASNHRTRPDQTSAGRKALKLPARRHGSKRRGPRCNLAMSSASATGQAQAPHPGRWFPASIGAERRLLTPPDVQLPRRPARRRILPARRENPTRRPTATRSATATSQTTPSHRRRLSVPSVHTLTSSISLTASLPRTCP